MNIKSILKYVEKNKTRFSTNAPEWEAFREVIETIIPAYDEMAKVRAEDSVSVDGDGKVWVLYADIVDTCAVRISYDYANKYLSNGSIDRGLAKKWRPVQDFLLMFVDHLKRVDPHPLKEYAPVPNGSHTAISQADAMRISFRLRSMMNVGNVNVIDDILIHRLRRKPMNLRPPVNVNANIIGAYLDRKDFK